MVRPSIDKVADLKGKTVAVAAPGSLPNLLVKAMLEKIPRARERRAASPISAATSTATRR